MKNKESYQALEKHFSSIEKLVGCLEILHWDTAVMMPPGSAETRAEQLAALHVLLHQECVDPRIGEWLELAKNQDLGPWQKANIEEMERGYLHSTALSSELVEKMSKASSNCEYCWRSARKENDFQKLVPHLSEVVNLTREAAQIKGEALGMTPYNALHDQFEPGSTTEQLDEIFDPLLKILPPLVQEVLEYQASQPQPIPLPGPFPVEKQKAFFLQVITFLGFDFEHGRMDQSLHPFCGGSPDDVRITTRYNEEDFITGMMSIIHETGHGQYERGLPKKWRFQPVGQARSLGMHESQSLLFELQACHSREFVNFIAPIVQKALGGQGESWTAENLYRHCTRVSRSLIRVNADEVTYPLHVILRYQLEKRLLSGDLEVADLPQAWNTAMKNLIGIVPTDDRDGCMQDIHWMDGTFGYFPTYTLGAMRAAQIFEAAIKAVPEILGEIGKGNFVPLLTWLRENIHSQGCLLSTNELLIKATGKTLDPSVFEGHLRRRYLGEE